MELVQKLAEWGTSDVFADALDAWMNERCTIFDRASNEDGSQPLDWGAAFAQYNDWLDSQLAKFCESVGAGAEEVSAAIAKSLEDGRETEFFPEFMRCTEYDEFLAQMQKRAQKTKSLATSRTKSSKSSSDEAIKPYDISGVWKADKSKYDADAVDKVLTYMACPYFARKILKHAARFVKDIVISVEGANNGASVILVYTLQLFGTTITTLKLGESVTVKNLWNKDVVCNTKIHDDSLRMQFSKHPGVPEGTVTDDKWFFLNGDTNTLVWEATCKRPDMEPLVNLQYFVREADAKAAGRRASMV